MITETSPKEPSDMDSTSELQLKEFAALGVRRSGTRVCREKQIYRTSGNAVWAFEYPNGRNNINEEGGIT
jgi:hypothetical protein